LKFPHLSKKLCVLVLSTALTCSFSGCVYLIVGGIGAVGGYIVSPDTVEGITENDVDIVWDTADDVISIMGVIKEKKLSNGMMLADVNGAKVTVTIISLGETATKVTVKARKAYLPKITLAQDVFVKIMSRVNE